MVMTMMLATACGKEDTKGTTTESMAMEEAPIVGQFCGVDLTYNPSDYLTLPDCSTIEVTKYEPTEEELQEQLGRYVSSWTHDEEIEKDIVEEGDLCKIDYVGSLDGVEFEGGAGTDFMLEIGSNIFIPGFESSLIGAKNKETTTINVTFPEVYNNNPDLAGKETQFVVTIKGIYKEVTYGLDDASVAENTEYATVEEFTSVVKQEMVDQYLANAAWEALYKKCEFKEAPTLVLQNYKKDLISQFQESLAMYGMTMESYLESYGYTQEDFETQMEATAKNYVEQDILLLCIALENNIEVSDEAMKAWANENYESLGYDSVEMLLTYMDTTNLKLYIISEKVLDIMRERAVVAPEKETTVEEN